MYDDSRQERARNRIGPTVALASCVVTFILIMSLASFFVALNLFPKIHNISLQEYVVSMLSFSRDVRLFLVHIDRVT